MSDVPAVLRPAPFVPTTVEVAPPEPAAKDGRSVGFWGIALVIGTEAMIFTALLSSYFFLRAAAKVWPPPGIEPPELGRVSISTVVLLGSSIPVFWAAHAVRRGRLGHVRVALAAAFAMGAVFLAATILDFHALHYGWEDDAYASIFYATVGLHALHVLVGLVMNLVVQAKSWTGRITARSHDVLEVFALYWHFVDVVWIFVFSSLFLSVRLR